MIKSEKISIEQFNEIVADMKNKGNNDLVKAMDFLTEDFDETKQMINKNSLKECKPGLTIINTSRGGVVNEEDVVSFLQKRKLYCYATDVITDENLNIKNSILIKNMERLNIIITPHVGGMTIEGQTKAYTWAINKL